MCEGPEVFALAGALQALGIPAFSYGTHLFLEHLLEDWSFTPRACGITVQEDGGLSTATPKHIMRYPVSDFAELIERNKLGVDWMYAAPEDMAWAVSKWSRSKKPLGALLASQYDITGIGSAWGSEICHQACVMPQDPSNAQNLEYLVAALQSVRDTARSTYTSLFQTSESAVAFVGECPENLKCGREMQVFKIGEPVDVNGHTWWL